MISEGRVLNLHAVPVGIRGEVVALVRAAREAGALGTLDYVGVGAYGMVFCDEDGHAWKVARGAREPSGADQDEWMREQFATEYEWLRDAADSPMADHVAQGYAYHAGPVVVERECVFGRPGGWADEHGLFELHREIERAMIPLGWTAPEFKGDSYIIEESGRAKLVDISMAQRVGENLAGWVEDVLAGRRKTRENWHSLAFFLLREMREKTVPEEEGCRILKEIVRRDPEVERGFTLPCPKT